MKYITKIKFISMIIASSIMLSCEEFLEVDVPDNRIISSTVFNDQESAESAVQGLYNELSTAYFAAGGPNSVSVLTGLSADNLITTVTSQNLREFEENELTVQNPNNYEVWSSAYNLIYQTNSVLEGLANASSINQQEIDRMRGEALFLRSFVYFYLVNLYGEVPLVLTTDYRQNSTLSSEEVQVLYNQIVNDLEEAKELLASMPQNKLRATSLTVNAFLARVYLYLENYQAAEIVSTDVISNSAVTLEANLDDVFLINSSEAIWQISPESTGTGALHTREGNFFILDGPPNSLNPVGLSSDFLEIYTNQDNRLQQWIASFNDDTGTYFYPFKYKVKYATTGEITEYTMVLRLAEQYLIRAEARANQGNSSGALTDLDVIRERAQIPSIMNTNPNLPVPAILDSIAVERRRELFTEWGHRWMDLKRTDQANEVLVPIKSLWESTDILYPIAEEELMKNPNLEQNPGY
ncbi:RagB/SusD family nutrient uptake outer membrane protein [Mesonia phycicola]|nr:RagB/SusD family nutrient uptake outer membrane protein [Mesonia phycicola]